MNKDLCRNWIDYTMACAICHDAIAVARTARSKWEMSPRLFSNFQMIVEQRITQGELSTHRYSVRSKTASGEPFQVMGMDMISVVDGKLVEHWALLHVPALQAHMTGK